MTNDLIITKVNERLHLLGLGQYSLSFIGSEDVLHIVHPSGILRISETELDKDLRGHADLAIGSIVQLIDRYDLIFSLTELCVSRLKRLEHRVHFEIGYFSFCKGACYNYSKKAIYLNPSQIFTRWSMYFKNVLNLSHFITILILHELGHVLQDQEKPILKRMKQFISGFNPLRITIQDAETYKQFLLQEEKDAWDRCEKYLHNTTVEPSSFSKIRSYCLNTYATLELTRVKRILQALNNGLD
ncbi:hypothetical protein [Peribacillus sp. SCS-155]|uniref:hypothetical protein n=1 Tax=Peribacillus sedimenti TaxID=3115297 RepID=UPI003905B81D